MDLSVEELLALKKSLNQLHDQKDLPPDFQKLVNNHFWDLIVPSNVNPQV